MTSTPGRDPTDADPIDERHMHNGSALLWTARVVQGSLLDADGSTVGGIEDIVVSATTPGSAPLLRGFIARVERRHIFVHQSRVDAVGRDGVHLRGGTVDLRRFKRRPGELQVVGDIISTVTENGPIVDVGFSESDLGDGTWWISSIAIGTGSRIRRRPLTVAPWSTVAAYFRPDPVAGELARLHDLHKADAAQAISSLSDERRDELAAALDAGRLADVLEELPEDEQAEILGNLATADALAVLEEMEVDDEIDLLKELPHAVREALLAEMAPEEVSRLRSLLAHREDTAGGMMTPEPIILTPEASVAEAIARLRDSDLPPALTVRLFVAESPSTTPTGKYLGTVTLPRLLKEPPSHLVGDCLDVDVPTVRPLAGESEVAELLGRYDMLSVAVVDNFDRLIGVVTVDDVIIRLIEQTRS